MFLKINDKIIFSDSPISKDLTGELVYIIVARLDHADSSNDKNYKAYNSNNKQIWTILGTLPELEWQFRYFGNRHTHMASCGNLLAPSVNKDAMEHVFLGFVINQWAIAAQVKCQCGNVKPPNCLQKVTTNPSNSPFSSLRISASTVTFQAGRCCWRYRRKWAVAKSSRIFILFHRTLPASIGRKVRWFACIQ